MTAPVQALPHPIKTNRSLPDSAFDSPIDFHRWDPLDRDGRQPTRVLTDMSDDDGLCIITPSQRYIVGPLYVDKHRGAKNTEPIDMSSGLQMMFVAREKTPPQVQLLADWLDVLDHNCLDVFQTLQEWKAQVQSMWDLCRTPRTMTVDNT